MYKQVDSEKFSRKTKWPFSKMEVGDCVEFYPCHASKAQAYAHTYAAKSGMKFETMKSDSGSLLVRRVS